MARKSLSSQVIIELDRIDLQLRPLMEISDQMTAHVISMALYDMHRIETMCLSAQQNNADGILDTVKPSAIEELKTRSAAAKEAAAGTHRATRSRKAASS